ncbi:winged helix-turn-helix domain-containing protein [Vibrio algarum]|uniref:Transcriptional regulator n=1 Tax=Vibrio algarum TaxID=3020714 RepID=A0ABT4YSN9_9VIBR|nr:transcriptional regulator [Vibrio sp. KJ40-1]MDB1124549.1 transcriptional regulator [Vibrio sp. KJ40-1]
MSSVGTKFLLAQRFVFDPNNNSLTDKINGNELSRLGSNESRILLLFCERTNQIITRDELHEFVWRDQGFQVDDSSLTQAISTLRKVLLDSTKAPKFVKTVPKRGYQFIATVEKTIPLSSSIEEETQENTEDVVFSADKGFKDSVESMVDNTDASASQESPQIATPHKQHRLITKLILVIAALLPIFVYMMIEPAPSKFKLVDTIADIPLQTTENHPPLDDWQPLINKCVSAYLTEHTEKPIKIIVTAGPNNNLMMNYVHSESNTSENITIQLIAKQQDMSALCRR